MKRGLVLTCLWAIGVTASVALAFAAVGRVGNRVAPPGVARLTARGVENELKTTTSPAAPTSTGTRASTSVPSSSGTRPTGSVPPTSVGPATSVPSSAPKNTSAPTTTPHNTVTTSQGGTLWTRCAGADRIVYVAALPKSEYERTLDDEDENRIEQWFEAEHHRSKITAECSNGTVHAEVEEESKADDD